MIHRALEVVKKSSRACGVERTRKEKYAEHRSRKLLLGHIVLYCLLFVAVSYTVYWTASQKESAGPRPTNNGATAQFSTTPGPITTSSIGTTNAARQVVFHDGKLSVRIKSAPLHWLLSEISTQSQIAIHAPEELGSLPISGELDRAPLAEGLLQLLRGFDVFLFYGATEHSSSALKAVWIYPKRKGETLAPFPLAANGGKQGERDTPKYGAATSFVAQAGLQMQDAAMATVELTRALQNPEAKVRFSALAASLENKIELPVHTLQQMAGSDPDREVRGLALTALTQNSEADISLVRTAAQMALRDSDPEIQAQAKGTLEYLDLAEKPNEDVSPLSQE
jgi:hypothetical protein